MATLSKEIRFEYGILFQQAIRMGFGFADAREWATNEYERRIRERTTTKEN